MKTLCLVDTLPDDLEYKFVGDQPAEPCNEREREVAELLDRLGLYWQYENHQWTFWREHGETHELVLVGFRPDFFIPSLNLFIEVTAGKSCCLGRKRQKVHGADSRGVRVLLIDRPVWSRIQGDPNQLRALL